VKPVTVGGDEDIPALPAAEAPGVSGIFAALMRLEYSFLQALAVQRFPDSGLPLWPRQITHGSDVSIATGPPTGASKQVSLYYIISQICLFLLYIYVKGQMFDVLMCRYEQMSRYLPDISQDICPDISRHIQTYLDIWVDVISHLMHQRYILLEHPCTAIICLFECSQLSDYF
jgi:hypothetical protein